MIKHPEPSPPEIDDELIHRFVDGALDARERLRVEALLSFDPDAFDHVVAYQRQNVMLQALHARREDDVLLPPAALGLARRLRHVQHARRAAAIALVAVVLVGTGALGWQAKGYLPGKPTPVVSVFQNPPAATIAAPAPVVSPPPGVRAVAQGSDTENTAMAGSLTLPSSRVAVHPPNLQTIGYQLVDGRADLTAYGPVIRFAYEPIDAKRSHLSLTVAAFGADRQSLATNINPQHTSLFWQDRHLLFALSGPVDPARLLRIAEVVNAERATAEPSTAAPALAGKSKPVSDTTGKEEMVPAPAAAPADPPKET